MNFAYIFIREKYFVPCCRDFGRTMWMCCGESEDLAVSKMLLMLRREKELASSNVSASTVIPDGSTISTFPALCINCTLF